MAELKRKLGRVPCPACGVPVLLRENQAGTITGSCDDCDLSFFAKRGAGVARKWRELLGQAGEPAPAASSPGEPGKPAPAPGRRVAAGLLIGG